MVIKIKEVSFLFILLITAGCLKGQSHDKNYELVKNNIVGILKYIEDTETVFLPEGNWCYVDTILDKNYITKKFVNDSLPTRCEIGFRLMQSDVFCIDTFTCNYQKRQIYEYTRNNHLNTVEYKYYIDISEMYSKKFENCFLIFTTMNFKKKYLYQDKHYKGILIVDLNTTEDMLNKIKYQIRYERLIPSD